jgi:hypothetical protein
VAETPLPPPPPPPRLELDEPGDEEIEDVLLAPGQEDIPLTPPPDEPRASRRPHRRRRPREDEDDEDVVEVYCPHCNRLTPADEERCDRCGEIIDDEEVEEMIEALKKERAFQNGMSFLFGVPGLVMYFVAVFMVDTEVRQPPALLYTVLALALLGIVLLFVGLGFACVFKGRNPLLGPVVVLSCVGLSVLVLFLGLPPLLAVLLVPSGFIILAALPDRKGRRLLRLKNLLRERDALGRGRPGG